MVLVLDKIIGLVSGKPETEGGRDEHGSHLRMRNVFAAPIKVARDFVAPLVPKSDEQVAFLKDALQQHFMFAHLSEAEQRQLVMAMELTSVNMGSTIIQQGDKGNYLYVISFGTVRFLVDGEDKGGATKGAIVGELALLYDCPRAATVLAETDCDLWRVSQHTFRRIKAAYALKNDHETRSTIRGILFFKDLSEDYVNKLADSLFQRSFKKGDVIVRKGEAGETMFIIKKGYIQGTDISVGTTEYADMRLGPGDYFGERCIVTGDGYAATVVALTDGMAWALTKERFLHTVGHLNLNELVIKSQAKKLLMAIPLFSYSDIDTVEMELMASQIEDVEHSKGTEIARVGQAVTPALYIIRTGAIQLSDGKTTKLLKEGEVFGFGQETLLLTNEVKQEKLTFKQDGFIALVAQAAGYLGKMSLEANTVAALHDVLVSEDAKLGMLTFTSIAGILYDINRLGASGTALDSTVTKKSLEKHRILGAGTFGQVWLTRDKNTNSPYALKIQYKREIIEYGQAKGVIREKNIMARMRHPFVMNIVNADQDKTCLYMVMNLLQGGELRSVMYTSKRGHLDERSARFYEAGILEGLSYMHRRHYVYRDLKPENVLFDQNGYCVIVDLGFAKFVVDKTYTFCGTPLFIAPEVILSKGHDKSADIWSFGILLYEMLTGQNPFYKDNMDQQTLFRNIVRGKWSFPERCTMSAQAKDLIEKILVSDPKERLGCLARADLDLREHPWFLPVDFCKLYNKEIVAPWVPGVRDPFDGSNFARWDHLEKPKEKKDLKPLSHEEQLLFQEF